jgi:NADH dehydrogenase
MQEGRYVAGRIRGRTRGPFRYHNKGQLAVIGRNRAVCDLGRVRFTGFIAWLIWAFVHIGYLIEFDNKLLVMVQWGFDYFTRKRGARLITFEPGPDA